MEMTLGERIRSLHRARALSPLYSDSDCIGLDYSRTLPRFAAICRNLPQAVIRGFGILRFAVADALVFAPIWEIKVGPPAYLVEGDAAFIRQRAEGTTDVFNG